MVGTKPSGPMAKRHKEFKKAIEDGDVDKLIELAEGSGGPRTAVWMVRSLSDLAFERYLNFNTGLIESSAKKRNTPLLLYHLTQEICFKAMLNDFERYSGVTDENQAKVMAQELNQIRDDTKAGKVGFSNSPILAKKVYVDYFEIYGKLLDTITKLAAIGNNESKQTSDLPSNYLGSLSDGRYNRLLRTKEERFIRNAITHKDFLHLKDGRFRVEDRDGKIRYFKGPKLDKILDSLVTKTVMVVEGMALPSAVQYQLLFVALKASQDNKSKEEEKVRK